MDAFKSDCSNCAGLCCIAYPFEKSEDFAQSKPIDVACPNLREGRCSIHANLKSEGYHGCAHYECMGAGQYVTQNIFKLEDAAIPAGQIPDVTAAFRTMCKVQDLRAMLTSLDSFDINDGIKAQARAMLATLSPAGGWTEARLAEFAASGQDSEARTFLAGLRRPLAVKA